MGIYPELTYCVLLAFFLLTSTQAQQTQPCVAPTNVRIAENNAVGDSVVNFTTIENAAVSLKEPDNIPFEVINGNQLVVTVVLDYETTKEFKVDMSCTSLLGSFPMTLFVFVDDVNDEPPVFKNSPYNLSVNEMIPIGATVGSFPAQDKDSSTLYYTLLSSSEWFAVPDQTSPAIVVQKLLDYDTVKSETLTLFVRDTPSPTDIPSFNDTTFIFVTIKDVDNRPPWFQPCTVHNIEASTKVCLSSGYTGTVNLTEIEAGPLTLDPGPLYAIDGDSGLNDPIAYRFINGDGDGVFRIDPDSGNISMVKAADKEGQIKLTVLATQTTDPSQFATTPVTITVRAKTDHPLRFEQTQYEAVVTGVGSMALNKSDESEPLRILAKDNDYPGGLNPSVTYEVLGSSKFSVIGGYLFMTENLPSGELSLQVKATDPSDGQSDTAALTVEVIAAVTSTTSMPSTTEITSVSPTTDTAVTGTTEITSGPSTTETVFTEMRFSAGSSTTVSSMSDIICVGLACTNSPSSVTSTMTPQTTEITSGPPITEVTSTSMAPSTTDITAGPPTTTSETVVTSADPITGTATTAGPVTEGGKSGDYSSEDMAALGASLAVLLVICLAVIGFLAHLIARKKADWLKISEASIFRSALGSEGGAGGFKKVVQYTNEGFQNDEDTGSVGSGRPGTADVKFSSGSGIPANSIPLEETIAKSTAPLHMLLPDNTSLAGSDKVDSEKEVKPILTKERRVEEGYKSVWFKEDIDPNAGDEVLIIPENRDQDGDDEEEEDGSFNGRDEDDNSPRSTPNVFFAEADEDSGLGVKIQDPTEDSDDDQDLTADL